MSLQPPGSKERPGRRGTQSTPEQWAFRAVLGGQQSHIWLPLSPLRRSLDSIPSLPPSGPGPGWATWRQERPLWVGPCLGSISSRGM